MAVLLLAVVPRLASEVHTLVGLAVGALGISLALPLGSRQLFWLADGLQIQTQFLGIPIKHRTLPLATTQLVARELPRRIASRTLHAIDVINDGERELTLDRLHLHEADWFTKTLNRRLQAARAGLAATPATPAPLPPPAS